MEDLINVQNELKVLLAEARKQYEENGSVASKLANQIETLKKEVQEKFSLVESRLTKKPVEEKSAEAKTAGQQLIATQNWLNFKNSGFLTTGAVNVGSLHQKAIVNAEGLGQPLVQAQRLAGIVSGPERKLTVRDLLPVYPTNSNMVEFAVENVFTNNAGIQYGATGIYENVAKPESNITFSLGTAPVRTIAHYITVSTQVLDDSSMLASYIDNRLVYGLKLKEEQQILTGNGTAGNLTGLATAATPYNTALTQANDTKIDVLRHAVYQVEAADYPVTGIVLNPKDWHDIELVKDTQGAYVFANPVTGNMPNIWGIPVVATNTLPVGKFLVGAFDMAAGIFDRMNATVEVSRSHSDNFVKNVVTILAEERIALAIFRPASLVYGTFA
jgi:HK97 family phage major capsid protein